MTTEPNKSLHTNRRSPVRIRARRFIGRWIRCERPLPAAVGELGRSANSYIMKYSVHSKMLTDLTPSSPRVLRHAWIYRLSRAFAWLSVPFCYLGLFLAPTVVFSIPFQFFSRPLVPSLSYWVTAGVVGAFMLWVIYRLAVFSYRSLVERVVDLEAIVSFFGVVFAAAIIVWIYRPR